MFENTLRDLKQTRKTAPKKRRPQKEKNIVYRPVESLYYLHLYYGQVLHGHC